MGLDEPSSVAAPLGTSSVSRAGRPPLRLLTLAAYAVVMAACGSTAVTSTGPSNINKCAVALVASAAAVSASGGSEQVVVTTTPECAWTASAEANWVGRIEPSSGQGSGTLRVDVAPNLSQAARQTAVVVNGVRALIEQAAAPPCKYAVSGSGSQSVAGSGATFQLTISTGDGCPWTATSPVTWVKVSAGSRGNGSGVVEFTVEPNDGSERVAALVVAGQSFTVAQAASGLPASPSPGSPQPGGPACAYALNTATLGMPATGGDGSVLLTTGCAWTAAVNVPWITVGVPSGTGNATIAFVVAINTGAARSGTISIGAATVAISQAAAAPCSFGVGATMVDVEAAASPRVLNVSGNPSCSWTATSGASWMTITSGAGGSGNGTVAFLVAANPGPSRTGTLTVAGHVVTVNQAAACTITASPLDFSIAAPGATGRVVTVTAGSGCGWSATSNASWISITGGSSGNGGGSVLFSVAANTGTVRNGTLTVAGQTITVSQSASCSYNVSPPRVSVSGAGGAGNFTVTAPAGCGWTATTTTPWLTITSSASGTSNGTVTFTALQNSGGTRTGSLSVAGQTVFVDQADKCAFTASVAPRSFDDDGGTAVATVGTASGCSWSVSSNAPWIIVPSPSTRSGPGTVSMTIQQNADNKREAVVTVAGQTFTIEQDKKDKK